MIISEKFVIGHIPKTGGHALAVMLDKIPNLEFSSPFNICHGSARSTEESKHKILSEVDVTGKDVLCVLRNMADWYLSYMVGQMLHYRQNEEGNLYKVHIKKTYNIETKITIPKLLPPELVAHSVFPDHHLQRMLGDQSNIIWLRQEYLADDLISYLKLEDPFVTTTIKAVQKHRHSYKDHTPKEYWNESSIKILYENNPLWAAIEQEIYQNIEQDYNEEI